MCQTFPAWFFHLRWSWFISPEPVFFSSGDGQINGIAEQPICHTNGWCGLEYLVLQLLPWLLSLWPLLDSPHSHDWEDVSPWKDLGCDRKRNCRTAGQRAATWKCRGHTHVCFCFRGFPPQEPCPVCTLGTTPLCCPFPTWEHEMNSSICCLWNRNSRFIGCYFACSH